MKEIIPSLIPTASLILLYLLALSTGAKIVIEF